MSRGGRGGASTGSRMRGQPLPFNVDPEIEAEAERTNGGEATDDNNVQAELFPDIDLIAPGSPTAEERKWVQRYRIRQARMRASPFWTGDVGAHASQKGDPDMPGGFNPFEDAPTFAHGKRKRQAVTPNLKAVKNIYPHLLPRELRHMFEDSGDGTSRKLKKLALAKQSLNDRLAKFDDDEPDAASKALDDEDKSDEEGEGLLDQLVDTTYEDEEDEDNDYNAEGYFEEAERDDDDNGGDDYGEEG